MQVTCGTLGLSTATVKLVSDDGSTHVACAIGTGPVDSAYKAVDLIVKVCIASYSLCKYFSLPFPLIQCKAFYGILLVQILTF